MYMSYLRQLYMHTPIYAYVIPHTPINVYVIHIYMYVSYIYMVCLASSYQRMRPQATSVCACVSLGTYVRYICHTYAYASFGTNETHALK